MKPSKNQKPNKRIRYYSDELNDDFAGTENIDTKRLEDDFVFINRNIIWRFFAFVLYYCVAFPLVSLISFFGYGMRVKNGKALRKIKGGCFLYGNHTQLLPDAYAPAILNFPRKAYLIVNPDAVSIKGIRQIVLMLGAIPIPSTIKGMKNFVGAVEERYKNGNCIAIYPEAHIWPYYTGIRPFKAVSFKYPTDLNAPCVACVTTYRRHKIFKNLPPSVTLTLSDPIYPDSTLPHKEAQQKLRDEIYAFMCSKASGEDNYAYVKYIKKDSV